MSGAELFTLDAAFMGGNLLPHQITVGSGDDHYFLNAHFFQRFQRIANHRLSAERHHYFRQIGFHPGSFAGG